MFSENGDPNANTATDTVDNQEFYSILGVQSDAKPEQIKKAYLEKVVKVHPDKVGGDAEEFKKLQAAYEVLSNPEKRAIYDHYGIDGLRDGAGGVDPFEGLFGGLFGAKGGQTPKLKPIIKEIKVTLEEFYKGGMKKVTFERHRICKACEGQGGKDPKQCGTCQGSGMVEQMIEVGPGLVGSTRSVCGDCKGEGTIFEEGKRCEECKGEKVKTEEKTLDVPIEQGAPSDHHISFSGEGNEYPGALAGDVIIQFGPEPHSKFERKGADLYYQKDISLYEALMGTAFYIEHFDKKKILVITSPNDVILPNMMKEVTGKGMPFYGDPMNHGHLFVVFSIHFPKKEELHSPEVLKQVLPVPKDLLLHFDKHKAETLKKFDEARTNPNPAGGKVKQSEEEDDDVPEGQRVQCAQQ